MFFVSVERIYDRVFFLWSILIFPCFHNSACTHFFSTCTQFSKYKLQKEMFWVRLARWSWTKWMSLRHGLVLLCDSVGSENSHDVILLRGKGFPQQLLLVDTASTWLGGVSTLGAVSCDWQAALNGLSFILGMNHSQKLRNPKTESFQEVFCCFSRKTDQEDSSAFWLLQRR